MCVCPSCGAHVWCPMTHSSVHTSCALFLPSTNTLLLLLTFYIAATWSVMDVDAPPVEELSCRVISLVEPLFPFSIQSKFKKTCFKLRFRFVVTTDLSSVFKGWKICRWRVFHKNLFATKEGGEKKELVWLRDPCKICHFNVCNVLRMHRDFLGKFFPPRHSRRVSS